MTGKRWALVSQEADTLDPTLSDRDWYFRSIIAARANYNPPVLSLVQNDLARVAGTSERTAAAALTSLIKEGHLQATVPMYRQSEKRYTPRLLTDLREFDIKMGKKFVAITEEVRDAYPTGGRDKSLRIHAYLMHVALRNGECPPNPYRLPWIPPSEVADVLRLSLAKVNRTYRLMREKGWITDRTKLPGSRERIRLPDGRQPSVINWSPGKRQRALEILARLDDAEWQRLVELATKRRLLDLDRFLDEARKAAKNEPRKTESEPKQWKTPYIPPPEGLFAD